MLRRPLFCLAATALAAITHLCRASATDPHFVQDRLAAYGAKGVMYFC